MIVGDGTPGPGRDRVVPTPEEFERRAGAYFAECKTEDKRPTINGLCLALGFHHKGALDDYAKYEGFSAAVNKARMQLEAEWEAALAQPNVAGSIFWLKQQGWKDTQDVTSKNETTHKGEIAIRPTVSREEWLQHVDAAARAATGGD